MKDPVIRAVYVGLLATFIKDIFDKIFMKLGFQGFPTIYMGAGVFLPIDQYSPFYMNIIGYTAHYIVGGILGFIFYKILSYFGLNYSIEKGIFFGLIVWLLLAGAMIHFGLSRYKPLNEHSVFMLLCDHIVFGLTLGLVQPRFVFRE